MSARMDHKIHIFGLHSNRWHGHESIRHHIMVIWRITAWNIVPFVNESWKLMLLNTLMFLPMGLFCSHIYKENKMELWKSNNCRGIDIFDDRVCTSCICRKNWWYWWYHFNTLGFLIGYILENLLQKFFKKQLGFGTEALVLVMINDF